LFARLRAGSLAANGSFIVIAPLALDNFARLGWIFKRLRRSKCRPKPSQGRDRRYRPFVPPWIRHFESLTFVRFVTADINR